MEYISRIKEIKAQKKMTTDKLSEISGVPLGTLTKILAGVSDSVKLSNIVAIAEALEVSLDYLVLGYEPEGGIYSLSDGERRLVERYRALDERGRGLVDAVISKEEENATAHQGKILQRPRISAGVARVRRNVPFFDLPVSAGPGEYLDQTGASETISIPDDERTAGADYAVRISGHSMEPRFRDGDIVLVENADAVSPGELCIYILDGCGYFKEYGGDCLISLNPEFGKIMFRDFESVSCAGRVIGKLRKSVVR